jgi:iron-sulfur cluster assembly 1
MRRQTSAAVTRLHILSDAPSPQLIRIGVRNKGCAGMSYHLEYVDQPAKFDEIVEQDGVMVLIDSRALFSIIGSEMDWTEDRIRLEFLQHLLMFVMMINYYSSRFVFKNPNVKDTCGCGESFKT